MRSIVRAWLSVILVVGCGAAQRGGHARSEPDWQPLSEATFAAAHERDALVLLSLQASWCHFCHVMNDETFADATVQAELRAHFVTVREEADRRPDLVARWGLYGWPATIVLDAHGHELLALRGYRERDAFLGILRTLVADREAGRVPGSSLPASMRSGTVAATPFSGELTELRTLVEAQVDATYDERMDGWGTPQKYPFGALVEHALFRAHTRGEALWATRGLRSLEHHAMLIDPIWGGLYQYSVEGDWDHPHYEKLATLQASGLASFAAALQATGEPRWRNAGDDVLRYLGEHLRSEEGAFFVSQDADLRGDGPPMSGAAFYALDAAERTALGRAPHIDEHVDADVNGLLVAALARWGFVAGDARAVAWAVQAADAIWTQQCAVEDGCAHEAGDGRRHLADQAAMLAGLVELVQVSPPGEGTRHLERAVALSHLLAERFRDADGGLRASLPVAGEPDLSGALRPFLAGAVAARALLVLDRIDEGAGHAELARTTLLALGDHDVVARQGRIVGELLLALDVAIDGTLRFTLVGDADDERTAALLDALRRLPEPRAVLEQVAPAASRYGDPGGPAVFLCATDACSPPITDPAELADSVAAFVASE